MTSASSCIVVMGPYRSGTSLVSQVLHALGVDFGENDAFQLEPDRFNPGGYFQRRDVVAANARLIGNASESIAVPAAPELILQGASADLLGEVDLGWRDRSRLFGLKDPRFCVTLLTWLKLGILSEDVLRIVRVTRDPRSVARSSILQKEVGSFCGYDMVRAEAMARTYDAYAAWHVDCLGVPSIKICYERLVHEPKRTITELALFIGQDDPKAIQRGLSVIGKKRALVRHYLHKLSNPGLTLATARKTLAEWMKGA